MFRETVSNADGTYFVSGIVPGVYELTAELQAFRKYQRKDVRLEVGKTTTIDIELAVGSLEEVVSVTAESPIVDITIERSRRHRHRLANWSSCHRSTATSLASSACCPASFRRSAPSRSAAIRFPSTGRTRATTTTCSMAPTTTTMSSGSGRARRRGRRLRRCGVPGDHEPVRRRVRPDGWRDHQCRDQAGVERVPRQRLRVRAGSQPDCQGLFREKSTTAKPDTSQWQWGGTIGGPIVKDKAHFFGSLERVMIDSGITINIPARPEFNTTTDHPDPRVEHDRALRSPDERQPHLGRPVAARGLAAVQPDHQPVGIQRRHAGGHPRGERRRSDGRDLAQVGARQHQGQHAARRLDAGRRVVRQPVLQRQRAQPGRVRRRRCVSGHYTDQQNAMAQARVNDAIQIEDTFVVVPAQARRATMTSRSACSGSTRSRATTRRTS